MLTRTAWSCSRRSGLTLIELIVVLTILIALAGLLVPMLPSMLTRAHTSTCSTNIAEAVKAIGTYQQLYSAYPNNWDALSDGTNMIDYFAGGSMMPAGVVSGGTVPGVGGNGELTAGALTANEVAALTGVGITQLQSMVAKGGSAPAGFDPTFNYYSNPTSNPTTNALTLSTTTKLALLDPQNGNGNATSVARCIALNLDLTGRYVALGIGQRVSMVGKMMATAPVHFGDQPVLNPEYGYQRLVGLFKVSTGNGTTAGPSPSFTLGQLVGAAPVHDTGLGAIGDELQNWYQLTTGGS
jgi:type II secretory pathway pseudopilin PulG